ncbi:MAG TPA: DEAD/DEAH box helicase [bacterium]|nr:DEAD/DEAH box helicase [bacterium]
MAQAPLEQPEASRKPSGEPDQARAQRITNFLDGVKASPGYRGQIVHVEQMARREPSYLDPETELSPVIKSAIASMGITSLYAHQARAIDHISAGHNVAIVTSTASGKTICYNIPVMETLLRDPEATALFLFPTKALAQDQLRVLGNFCAAEPSFKDLVHAGTYDGDTPAETRRKLRNEANVILTNPDMLHQGILPYHSRWSRFFARLKYVVVDEMHTYRGIFGSNVANVLRRLGRVVQHYGGNPVFVLCSATIANPRELAESLIGMPCEVVSEDGSPRGPKLFVLWNPTLLDAYKMERKSSNVEAHELMVGLVEAGIQTITFTKARVVAELVLRYVRESLARRNPHLVSKVSAYRAGYLPEERRKIEKALFSGELLGVASTNALELGIDVGSLDASIIVGFPGTIASTWQQAGRAGRKTDEALVVFIGYNDPIDQYLMRHPSYFFGQTPENAVIDPMNPYILAGHLSAAAFELPLSASDEAIFGPLTQPMVSILEEVKKVKTIEGQTYWATTDFPAAGVSLRTISDDTFTIVDRTDGERVIGVVDAISAPELVYPEGVYIHDGSTYLVRKLDLEGKVAYVERQEVDYYTQPILDSSIRAGEARKTSKWGELNIAYGDATVSWMTTAFKKIKFYSLDSIGYGRLDLPPQHLETVSLWMFVDDAVAAYLKQHGKNPVEGLVGLKNVLINILPLFVMCDRQDMGGIVESSNTGRPTIFLYDRFKGGLGFCEKAYALVPDILRGALDLIEECPCAEGCPSCVGLPILRPAQHQDPDPGHGYPIPDKEASKMLLRRILGAA